VKYLAVVFWLLGVAIIFFGVLRLVHTSAPKLPTKATVSIETPKPPEEPGWVSMLRIEAKKKQVNFNVFCMGEDSFWASAWPYGATRSTIIENGGRGEWIVGSFPTQREAAIALTFAIAAGKGGLSWYPPEHQTKEEEEHKHLCPPEIRGGEGMP
jgi:hypothetical protein